ncbi:MAG: DNA polymerase III subunit delta' [Weeksellaceae bacterium]|nr:DNA polymerase III subunit delta' [Weeksellaceae bacterium]
MSAKLPKIKDLEIHRSLAANFLKNLDKGIVPHALLLHGKSGYGLLAFAVQLSQALLCTQDNQSCRKQVQKLIHPDLHLIMPVFSDVKGRSESKEYLKDFQDFFEEHPFGGLNNWMTTLNAEKKQGVINVKTIVSLLHEISMQSFSGGYKVIIIWLAEYMNNSSANKILKILEEPPAKTVFFLLSEQPSDLLPTILSRCQQIQLPALGEVEIRDILTEKYSVEPALAKDTAAQAMGNVTEALEMLKFSNEEFENLFIDWVRNAFLAKKQLAALAKIRDWSITISSWNREKQKQFLQYCAEIFRNALLFTYSGSSVSRNVIRNSSFNWQKFAPYIHGSNIEDILHEINEAAYHIDRNGNAKIIFLDLGIKLIRFIHKQETTQA